MIQTLFCLVAVLRSGLKEHRELALENLPLRQKPAILTRAYPTQAWEVRLPGLDLPLKCPGQSVESLACHEAENRIRW